MLPKKIIMNNLQVFSNSEFGQIRATTTETGKPIFCLADVAKALGYSNPPKAVIDHYKGVTVLETPTKNQHGTIVFQKIKFGKEGDVYRLVMRSKLPEAEKFQDWVTDEVLPSVRKHGAYMTSETIEKALMDSDTIIRLASDLKEERKQKERLKTSRPKNPKVAVTFVIPKLNLGRHYTCSATAKHLIKPLYAMPKNGKAQGKALFKALTV